MIIDLKSFLQKKLVDDIIIFETDTVYGIGCLLNSENGVKRIYEIKSRKTKNPLVVLCANLNQVKMVVKDFEKGAVFADRFWPGALTLVFDKQDIVPKYITSGLDTVGVRIPNSKTALAILEKFGPMAVTSMNISKEPSILRFSDVLEYENVVDYIVEGNDLSSLSSTVFDIVNNRVLREGEIKINS